MKTVLKSQKELLSSTRLVAEQKIKSRSINIDRLFLCNNSNADRVHATLEYTCWEVL